MVLHVLYTKFSFAKLNDLKHIGNVQRQQCKQNNKVQNFSKVNNKDNFVQSLTLFCVVIVNVKHI